MRVGGPGDDLTKHFPLIVEASARLRAFGPGLRSKEWIDGCEHNRATLFFHACQLGLEGDRVEAEGLAVSLGALDALA